MPRNAPNQILSRTLNSFRKFSPKWQLLRFQTRSSKIARSLMTVDIFIAGNNAVSMVLKMTLDQVSDKCIFSMLSVRALASHQCGLGFIPDLGVICGLSLLLVLALAP